MTPNSQLIEFEGYRPRVAKSAFIAPTAMLIGNVRVEEGASVWYGAVLRADHGEQEIVVGARSNVQDNCVIHVAYDHGTIIGEDVTVGHGAILEGCDIEDRALIGMNAVVLDHARVGAGALLGAGSILLAGAEVPTEMVATGCPAEAKKAVSGRSREWIENASRHYVDLAQRYREEGLSANED